MYGRMTSNYNCQYPYIMTILGRVTKLKLVRASSLDDSDLLSAAGRLFRRKGFAASTVREIASAAGILPGSLHYRYSTKESILLDLMERGIGAAIAAVRSAMDSSPDPVERIRLALRAHLSLLLSDDDAIYVLLYEWRELVGEPRDAMARLRDRYDALWDGLLYRAAGSGRLRPGIDIKLVRLFILGSINWVPQWYSPKGGHTPEQIADIFFENLLLGLAADDEQNRRSQIGEKV
jgi:AcrR family transcriptional regulator